MVFTFLSTWVLFRLVSNSSDVQFKFRTYLTGYMLLAGRVRHSSEAAEIANVLEAAFKCKLDPLKLFTVDVVTTNGTDAPRDRRAAADPLTWPLLSRMISTLPSGFESVVWTYSMRRMALMVEQALRFGEPVLLVGETG